MDDNLRKEIEDVVSKIFSEQEESEQRKQTEDMLTQSAEAIDSLTTSLESKTEEVKTLEASVDEKDKKIEDLNTELEAARKEIEDYTLKLSESEQMVANMQKDMATKERMIELEEASVVTNPETVPAKVREMTDEEFAAYKDELISLRKAVEVELAKSLEKPEPKKEDEIISKEEVDEEVASDDGTPPANVDTEDAVSAALNLEVSSNDIKSKYQKLGQAMADSMKKKK